MNTIQTSSSVPYNKDCLFFWSNSTFLLSIWNLKGMVFTFLIYTNILFAITQVFFRRCIAVLFSFRTLNRITLRRRQSRLSQYVLINSSIIYPWPSSKITSICLVFDIAACHSWYWFLTKSISTAISKYQRLGSLYLCCAVLSRPVFVTPWPMDSCLLPMSSHGRMDEPALWVLLSKGTNFTHEESQFPKSSLPKPIKLGVRISRYVSGARAVQTCTPKQYFLSCWESSVNH